MPLLHVALCIVWGMDIIMRRNILFILIWAVLLLTALSGCAPDSSPAAAGSPDRHIGENTSGQGASSAIVNAAEEPSKGPNADEYSSYWEAKGKEWGEWPSYFDQFDCAEEQFGDNAGKALMEGLSSKYPVVKWYCAYKVTEYINIIDRERLRNLLQPLVKDEKEFVSKAADFTLAVLDRNYDHPGLYRSGDKKRVAFTRFPEAQYNDGKVLVMENGKLISTYKGINAGILSWSPDSRQLAVANTARTWIETQLVNTGSGEAITPDLFQFIVKKAADYDFSIGSNQRPDPYVQFMEWSPDSQKALLSLSFTDDRYVRQRCLSIYDLTSQKVVWLLKLTPSEGEHADFEKPQGFGWDQPDYGIRSGRLENLAELRKNTDAAFKKLIDGINKEDVKAVREFTDPDSPWRFTDEMLKAALEDYREYFRGQGIVRYEFVGISPYNESAVIYRAFNQDGRFKDIGLTYHNGRYECRDNFLYYSFYARQLSNTFIDAVKSGDSERIAAALREDDLAYPRDKVPQILGSYKSNFDLKSLTAVFSGNMTGEAGEGDFIYRILGTRNGMPVEHELRIAYGDGLVGLRDDWVPPMQ